MGEVVVSASRPSSNGETASIQVWELKSGTIIGSYRSNASDVNAFTLIGDEVLASVQYDSSTIHFWSWKKPQPFLKSTLPEKISSICTTHDGVFCVAGGLSGRMYIWEIATGMMIRSWEGHYKKVTTLVFTDDDCMLISGGEDAVLNVWNLGIVLNNCSQFISDSSTTSATSIVKPFHSFTDHSLPISGVVCGHGSLNGRLVSVSLDRTCKIWNIPTKTLVASVVLPAGLTCVTTDPTEHAIYIGALDGNIYQIDLLHVRSVSNEGLAEEKSLYHGHSQAITSVDVSWNGSMLVSASLDGTCKVWDTTSKQLMKTFLGHKGGFPTHVQIVVRPPELLPDVSEQTVNVKPVVQSLKKFSPSELVEQRTIPIKLTLDTCEITGPSKHKRSPDRNEVVDRISKQYKVSGSQGNLNLEVEKLKSSVLELETENLQWRKLSTQLYDFCTSEVLKGVKRTDVVE